VSALHHAGVKWIRHRDVRRSLTLTKGVRRSLRLDGILQWLPRMALLHDSAVRYTTGNKVVGLTGFSPATFALGVRCSLNRAAGRFKNWYLRQELHPHDDVRSVAS
jgi:hypothetical protein